MDVAKLKRALDDQKAKLRRNNQGAFASISEHGPVGKAVVEALVDAVGQLNKEVEELKKKLKNV